MAPIRLLLATYAYPPSVGGVEQQSHRLARGLVLRGHQVHVVTAEVAGSPAHEVSDGVVIERVSAGTGSRWQRMATYLAASSLAVLRARHAIDIVHCQQALYPAAALTVLARGLRLPMVVGNSGSGENGAVQLMSRLPMGRHCLRTIGALATTVSLSADMTAEMRSAGFRSIVEIPNGVSSPPPRDRRAARRALGIPDATPVVLYVGRLAKEKGTALLAQTWPHVKAAIPDALLLVAGDGPERPLLDNAGLSDVRIDGYVSDPSTHYAAADVFVLPSESEGISNALLEAMAIGLPVVATAVGGNLAVVSSPEIGLTAPRETAAIAYELLRYLRDPALAARVGAAARAHVAAHWSEQSMLDAYERLYRRQTST